MSRRSSPRMDRSHLVGDIVSHWQAHVDGGIPKSQRDAVLAQLAAGKLDVVTNCMVLTEGWDMPDVGCCILARMGLYRQMVGRVLRPASNKYDAIVLDH